MPHRWENCYVWEFSNNILLVSVKQWVILFMVDVWFLPVSSSMICLIGHHQWGSGFSDNTVETFNFLVLHI